MTWPGLLKKKYTYDTFSDYPNETPEVRTKRLFREFDTATQAGLEQLRSKAPKSKELNNLIQTQYNGSSNRFTYCVECIKEGCEAISASDNPTDEAIRDRDEILIRTIQFFNDPSLDNSERLAKLHNHLNKKYEAQKYLPQPYDRIQLIESIGMLAILGVTIFVATIIPPAAAALLITALVVGTTAVAFSKSFDAEEPTPRKTSELPEAIQADHVSRAGFYAEQLAEEIKKVNDQDTTSSNKPKTPK